MILRIVHLKAIDYLNKIYIKLNHLYSFDMDINRIGIALQLVEWLDLDKLNKDFMLNMFYKWMNKVYILKFYPNRFHLHMNWHIFNLIWQNQKHIRHIN